MYDYTLPMRKVCIAFTPAHPSEIPNASFSNLDHVEQEYYQMILVSFFMFRKNNPEILLELVTTHVPQKEFRYFLDFLNVKINLVPFTFKPPVNFYRNYGFSFYLLDAIKINQNFDTLYVDPDVLCLKNLATLFDSLDNRLAGINCEYPMDFEINGLTRRKGLDVALMIDSESSIYPHIGGEILFVPKLYGSKVVSGLNDTFTQNLSFFSQGLDYFTTEEHLISFCLRDQIVIELNSFAKRVWTRFRYNNVDRTERDMYLLHFPAEKQFGFKKLFHLLQKDLKGMESLNDEYLKEFILDEFLFKNLFLKKFLAKIFSLIIVLKRLLRKLLNSLRSGL